jgi:hypothetical protein
MKILYRKTSLKYLQGLDKKQRKKSFLGLKNCLTRGISRK